jgi:hypothetical protein
MVSFMPWSLCPWEKSPQFPLDKWLGGPQNIGSYLIRSYGTEDHLIAAQYINFLEETILPLVKNVALNV